MKKGKLYKIVSQTDPRVKFFSIKNSNDESILLEVGSMVLYIEEGEQAAVDLFSVYLQATKNIIKTQKGFWFLDGNGKKFFVPNENINIFEETSCVPPKI